MNSLLRACMPALLSFGPLILAIAASSSSPSLAITLIGYAAALGMTIALLAMFVTQTRLEQEVLQLRRAAAESDRR